MGLRPPAAAESLLMIQNPTLVTLVMLLTQPGPAQSRHVARKKPGLSTMLTKVLTLLKMMAVRTRQALVRQAVRPQAKSQVRRAPASRRTTCKQMEKSNMVILMIQYVSMCPPPI